VGLLLKPFDIVKVIPELVL